MTHSVAGHAPGDSEVNVRSREVLTAAASWLPPRNAGAAGCVLLGAALLFCAPVAAVAGGLSVENAWVAPNDTVGSDIGLYMTVKNDADEADALIRAACPFANFSEKRTVDVGEGGLANRAINNIPLAAHSTLTMTSKTYHVGLLQTREKLDAGQSFTCNLSFRKAGPMEVKVTVTPAP